MESCFVGVRKEFYMKKIMECDEAIVEREVDTPVYVGGSLYTTFKLGNKENIKVNNLEVYVI
jgi:hypothetical protein